MSRPRVILHIGRNKAGSTTIQEACLASLPILEAHGIGYGLFGHLWQSRDDVPGWMTFDALAGHAQACPDTTWLVSNEFMFAWPDAFTQDAARALVHCDVSIVAYVRRYDHWVRSAYAEETRAGMNCRDIDTYVRDMAPRISALPNLNEWARCFGWHNLRVRSIHPADLKGGELLSDFAEAIGLPAPLMPVADRNVAPGWMELELVRRLTERDAAEERGGADHVAVAPLAALMRAVGDTGGADYLSADQHADLLARYAGDAAMLRSKGQKVSAIDEEARARAFLPAFERISPSVLTLFFEAASAPAFIAEHPAAAEAAARLRGHATV